MWERTPLTGHLNIFESWYSKVPGEILFIEITYYLIRRVALSMEYTLPFLHSVRSITRPKPLRRQRSHKLSITVKMCLTFDFDY